ncbi:MAG: TRAP transporter substrate-binding protein DctP [Pseudomonadota bacterium]
MYLKKIFFVAIAAVLGLSLNFSPFTAPDAQAKTITIKAISAWPTNDGSVKEDYLGFVAHANKVLKEKMQGQVEIKYIGGPEAIPVRDQAEAVRVGTVDMYFGTQAYYEGIAPEANIAKMTLLTPWEERESGAYDIFNEIHQKKLNAFYLGRPGNQIPFQMWGNMNIKSPDELKGRKIRTSPMYIDFLKALGAIPISTKPGDIYQAMERKVVDGFCWPFTKVRDWGFHEVTKYVIGPGFYNVCHPVIINLDKWKQLPESAQKILIDVMKQEERAVVARDLKKIEEEKGLLKKAGMTFIEFSPADTKRYLDLAWESGWEGLAKRSPEYASKLKKALAK